MTIESVESYKNMVKKCPKCDKKWPNIYQFLQDKSLKLIGYQAHPSNPENGLMLFNHLHGECGTTLAISVKIFLLHFSHDAVLKSFVPGEALDCPGYCLDCFNLERCIASKECHGKAARNLIEVITEAMNRVA